MNFPKADLKKRKYELLFITRIRNIAIAIATIFSETQYSSRSSYPEMYLKNCLKNFYENSDENICLVVSFLIKL